MLENVPAWLDVFFLLTTAATIVLFYLVHRRHRGLLLIVLAWAAIHSVLAWQGVYLKTKVLPPPLALVLAGATMLMLYGLFSPAGRKLRHTRNPVLSTLLHTVRVPVEITLFFLYLYGTVPELMTFSGRNFDILAGITAPVVAWLLSRGRAPRPLMIAWNVICLALVSFILTNGILSAELPIQQFAFDQPNRAVLYFPYVLLPVLIVPIVMYTHLSDLIIYLDRKGT